MYELERQLEALVARNDYAKAISLAESALAEIPPTAFHKVMGRDFLHLIDESAQHISGFFEEAGKRIKVEAMFLDMNGFGMNPDMWSFESFAFSACGDPDDATWLADYDFAMHETVFQMTGWEDLQEACRDHLEHGRYHDEVQREAKYAFERIVAIRFTELLAHAVQSAKDRDFAWKHIPVFGTAHDNSLLYRPSGKQIPGVRIGAKQIF